MALFNLAGRVVEEIDLVGGGENCLLLPCVNDKLQKLRAVIVEISPVLADAEEQARKTQEVRSWVMKVGDVLHDAEDLVAQFRAETESVKIFRKVRSSPTQLVFGLKIGNVLEKLDELGPQRMVFSLKEQGETSETGMGILVPTFSLVDELSLFERKEDKAIIVNMLLDFDFKQDGVSVLPIVGMGGVGKTTLAQSVYNDARVIMQFEKRMWISVSQRFDIKSIMRALLGSLGSDSGRDDLNILVGLLREKIYRRRYLLVLDDVWHEDDRQWDVLMRSITVGADKRSWIIVTTRKVKVAEQIARIARIEQIGVTVAPQYDLHTLDEDNSWSVFKKIIRLGGSNFGDVATARIAYRVVRRCGGNPLAIRVLANVMRVKRPEQWCSFLLDWEQALLTQYESLDSEQALPTQDERLVLETIRLSYNQLPSHQKECFAYCRLFPKGYEIDVKTLVNFWISQGFVRSSRYGSDRNESNDLEDNGYLDFKDLLQRSFFHESEADEWGNVTKCKMPNLMHDFAISAAEKRFATLELRSEKMCDAKTHHVSFNSHLDSPWQIPSDLFEAKRIRTILLFRQSHWEVKGRSSDSIFDVMASRFKFVRTLDMNNSGIKVVPDSIGELKLLKYLDLSRNKDIKVLPKSFSGLQNLHTLKLNDCGRLRELPRDIKKLVKLRNLEIDSCYSLTHMPCGLGQLTDLRTLSGFVLSRGISSKSRRTGELDELAKLNNLRGKLVVKNLRTTQLKEGEDKDVPAEVLKQKLHLRSVMLIWDTVATSDTDERKASGYKLSLDDLEPHLDVQDLSLSAYGGTVFSKWLPLHENLVNLSLSKCGSCSNIPLLNRLTRLKVLVLDEMANLEYISDNFENSSVAIYPSLKELRLTNLPKLDRWWKVTAGFEEMKFPCLSKLIVEDCPNLNSMPLFPSLKELLLLKNTRWEPFQQIIRTRQVPSQTTAEASSSSTSSNLNTEHPLSELRTLCIIQMSNVDTDMWQYLRSLHSLTFDHLSNVETLLEGLQDVTSLQELHIWRCDSLNEIASRISGLTSLRKLSIRLCPKLTILPNQIGLITSLEDVEIKECPEIVHVENLLKDRLYKR